MSYNTKNSRTVVTHSRCLISGRLRERSLRISFGVCHRRGGVEETRRKKPQSPRKPHPVYPGGVSLHSADTVPRVSHWKFRRRSHNLSLTTLEYLHTYTTWTQMHKTFTGSFRSPFEHNWACSRVQQAYCISFGRKHGEIKVCQG